MDPTWKVVAEVLGKSYTRDLRETNLDWAKGQKMLGVYRVKGGYRKPI